MSRQPSGRSTSLQARLRQLRRRVLWIGGSAGIAWGLAGAVVLVVVAAWLDLIWEMPAQARIAMLACAGAAGLLVAATLLARAIQGGRDASIARRLDHAGNFGGRILTGVELDATKPGTATFAPELTQGLARIAVSHAAEAAVQVPSSRAVPAVPLRRSLSLLGIELTAVALLAACLPGLIQTQWERFLHPYTDVPPYSPIRIVVEPGDTQVVYGDSLDLHARAEGGPVDRLELVLGGSAGQPAETLPMFPEPDGRWRAALARVTESAVYFVRAYRARSPQYNIGLITVPRIAHVRFRVEPPSYTRLAPYQGPMPKGGLSGLPGTKVQVWAKSNRPLSGGVLTVTTAAGPVQQQMQPSQPGASEATVQFAITADAKFRVDLRDVDGQESREPFLGTVTLLADQRPFLRILKPPAMSLATPNTVLPVILSAEDDYGISRLQLYRSLNDSRPLSMDVSLVGREPRRGDAIVKLPLDEYGLEPGDTIRMFARVEDNDPAGHKGAETPQITVQIISQQEFERMLRIREGFESLVSKYRQAERRMESLTKELEGLRKKLSELPPKGRLDPKTREQLRQLAERVKKDSAELLAAAKHRLPYDIDEELTQELQRLAEKLGEQANLMGEMAKRDDADNELLAEQIKKLLEKLAADRGQFDREAMQAMERLAAVFPLMADGATFVELAARQEDLARRMASLKGHDGEDDPVLKARMRDLEEEQRKIREDLNGLLDRIGDHLEQLPEDPEFDELRESAAALIKAVRESGAAEAMSQAEEALAEFAGTRAHEQATKAAEILARFISLCDGKKGLKGCGMRCLVLLPSLNRCLKGTIGQLLGDMGMDGMGMGGSRGGYSMRSRGNVGLYGSLPGMGREDLGDGSQGRGEGHSGEPAGGRNSDGAAETLAETSPAAGGGQSTVPMQYRRRVGQYFQRIAEEVPRP